MSDKSKHYTSAQNYKDLDGNIKSFTFVDHDIKTKGYVPISSEEISEAKKQIIEYRKSLIERIKNIPAVHAPEQFWNFRLIENQTINWNINMLSDEGIPIDTLRELCVRMENKLGL
jgi:hypothetical protein